MSHSINSRASCIIISAHASSQQAESPDRHVATDTGAKKRLRQTHPGIIAHFGNVRQLFFFFLSGYGIFDPFDFQ